METAIDEILSSMSDVSAENKDVLRQAFQLVQDEADMARARADEQEARADGAEIDAALWKSDFLSRDVPDEVHRLYVREHFRGCFGVEDGRIVAHDPRTGEVIAGEDGQPASVDDAMRLLIAVHLPDGHRMIRRRPDPMEATHYTPPVEKKKRPHSTASSSGGQGSRS